MLFVAIGLAVAADAAGWLPSPRSRVFPLPGPAVSFAVAVVGAAALAMLTPHGAVETVVLVVIGVAAIVIGWVQPVRPGGPSQFSGELPGGLTGEILDRIEAGIHGILGFFWGRRGGTGQPFIGRECGQSIG